MLSVTLLRAELLGLLFWLVSLFFVRRASELVLIAWHFIAATLSVVVPLAGASWAIDEPAGPVTGLWLLGFLNGLLGALWCARVEPKFSTLPMLCFAVGGAVLFVVVAMSSFKMTRMF